MKINKKTIVLLLFAVFGAISAKCHPFYVSLCQVDYNSENNSLEISLKIFADDLVIALEQKENVKLYLGEKNENERTDTILFNYLKENLKFRMEDQELSFNFIGKELEKDVVWTYLEIEKISELNYMEVTNSLLIEVYSDQKNIVQVSKNGIIKNLLLTGSNTKGVLSFVMK